MFYFSNVLYETHSVQTSSATEEKITEKQIL